MAKELPDPIDRRHLLSADPKRQVDHAAYADRYLENGRKSDALDFGEKSQDPARKAAIRDRVRDEGLKLGDYFLLARVDAVAPLDASVWRQALGVAKSNGKLRYALKIAKKLGDAAEIAALEAQLRPPGAPAPSTDGAPSAAPSIEALAEPSPSESTEPSPTEGGVV